MTAERSAVIGLSILWGRAAHLTSCSTEQDTNGTALTALCERRAAQED